MICQWNKNMSIISCWLNRNSILQPVKLCTLNNEFSGNSRTKIICWKNWIKEGWCFEGRYRMKKLPYCYLLPNLWKIVTYNTVMSYVLISLTSCSKRWDTRRIMLELGSLWVRMRILELCCLECVRFSMSLLSIFKRCSSSSSKLWSILQKQY